MTLTCEDANSILVEVVTVGAEKCVGTSQGFEVSVFGDADVWLRF